MATARAHSCPLVPVAHLNDLTVAIVTAEDYTAHHFQTGAADVLYSLAVQETLEFCVFQPMPISSILVSFLLVWEESVLKMMNPAWTLSSPPVNTLWSPVWEKNSPKNSPKLPPDTTPKASGSASLLEVVVSYDEIFGALLPPPESLLKHLLPVVNLPETLGGWFLQGRLKVWRFCLGNSEDGCCLPTFPACGREAGIILHVSSAFPSKHQVLV